MEQTDYPYLEDLSGYLNSQLQCHEFHRLDSALNGLQVGNTKQLIHNVVAAVDASLESLERAADLDADLLIVHHGIFWGQFSALTGMNYRRLAMLFKHNMALYAVHLPLDAHIQYGNNIHLAECLSLHNIERFGAYKGQFIGCMGKFSRPHDMEEICNLLRLPMNVLCLEFSRRAKARGVQTVGIVAGGGALALEEAAAKGCDLLITGELLHQHYHTAKELGINVLAMGHYQSETGGVQRLLKMLQERWPCITYNFIDLPTGL